MNAVSYGVSGVGLTVQPVPDLKIGIWILKTAPHLAPDETHVRPPWASMIDRQIDSPIPMPWLFVVKSGSKIRSTSFGSTPVPESSTDNRTSPESGAMDFTVRTRA